MVSVLAAIVLQQTAVDEVPSPTWWGSRYSLGSRYTFDLMLDRHACERRVYRLATLLTGNPIAATGVIRAVIGAQPDLGNLDNAHMDRLTVLRSREIAASTLVGEAIAGITASALADLAVQQREAWIFSRVYRLGDREMARAMDCSTTALKAHLDQAEAAMGKALGSAIDKAAGSLLDYSLSLEVPPFYRENLRKRRRMKLVGRAAIWLLAIAVVVAVGWWVRQAVIDAQGEVSEDSPTAAPR